MEYVDRLKLKYLKSDSLTESDKKTLDEYISTLNEKEINVFNQLTERFHYNVKYGVLKNTKLPQMQYI